MQCPHCPKMERLQRFANHLSGHHRRQFAMDTMYELVKAYNRRSPIVKAYGVFCCLGCGVAYKTLEQCQKHYKSDCWDKAMMLICDMVYLGFKANPESAPPGLTAVPSLLQGADYWMAWYNGRDTDYRQFPNTPDFEEAGVAGLVYRYNGLEMVEEDTYGEEYVCIGRKVGDQIKTDGIPMAGEEGHVLPGFRVKIEEPKAEGPTIRIKRRPVAQPVQQEVIIASVVEPAEPAIEVTRVTRISLKSLTVDGVEYWLVKDKVYEKRLGRGAYIGRYDGTKIDCTADDSDDE